MFELILNIVRKVFFHDFLKYKTTTYNFQDLKFGCNHAKQRSKQQSLQLYQHPFYCTSRIRIRCCDITVDSATPATWNGACTERWTSKQMHHLMCMFHNCSITKQDGYERASLFYNFWSKPTRSNWMKVWKQFLVNCPPFWTESLKELCHFKTKLFSFVSVAPF